MLLPVLLRRILFPLQLVAARVRSGGQRLLLVALGTVAGAAVLAAVLGGRLVMQDQALARAAAQLSPGDRTVQVAWSGDDASVWQRLDRLVEPRLRELTGRAPAAAMLFREASIQGRLVNIRAADDLGRYVRLVAGRLPTVCRPGHCEVLRLQGSGPIPSTPRLRLVEVGRATLKPDAPFASFVLPAPRTEQIAQAVRYHTPQPSPIVIANGVSGLARNTELETFYRSYAWFVPVGGGDVHPWALGSFARRVQAIAADLEARNDALLLSAPTDQLATAAAASRTSARRLLLLGGEGGALLLAFTILAASALRRDVTDARRRLVLFGARRWQVELFTLAESAVLAAAGTVAGWVVGGGVAALVAVRAGSPPGQVVVRALLSGGGIAAALAIAGAATLLLYATVRAPAVHLGRLALTPLDAAALGAVAVVLVGWARGSVDAAQLGATGGGTSAFLVLVPALVVFAAAVVAARLLGPALRGLGRLGRSGPIALRLAANSLARSPGHAAVAATFLVASLGLALFAVAYRSTLERGEHDEASYAVPASFVLSEDFGQLIPVLHGAPLSAYPGRPTEVLRLTGTVPSGATFGFLGVPAGALVSTGGWRDDFASRPLASLASALAPRRSTALRTLALPPGRRFSLPVSTRGDDVAVRAYFRSALGDVEPVTLGRTHGRRRVVLRGRIPFPHATLMQLELDLLNGIYRSANGGIGIQPSAKGVLVFGRPEVDGRPAGSLGYWVGSGGASAGGGRVGYVVTSDRRAALRPRQPTDGRPLPVLATPGVVAEAGPDGILPLQIEGEDVPARVVGTIRRFPSIVGDAIVADRTTVATMLDTSSPGVGVTDELWLNVPPDREAAAADLLARRPFTALAVQSRAAQLAQLEADPLARGALLTLAGTAGVALALALLGLLLSVVGDVRDDRGELFDLEAQGAAPTTIRAHLRLRAALVAAFGIAGGLALGAILSALVVSLVSVTAGSAAPEPPLRLHLDAPLLAAGAGAYVVLAALLVGLATRTRGHAPTRAVEAVA